MNLWWCSSACLLLSSCAIQTPQTDRAAVEDFIAVHGMEQVDLISTRGNLPGDIARPLNEYHMRYKARGRNFLIVFAHRCPVWSRGVTTDVRSGNILRAQSDTIRGCRIGKIYRMTREQAVELRTLGKAPPT